MVDVTAVTADVTAVVAASVTAVLAASVTAEVRIGRPGVPGNEPGVEPHDAERIEQPQQGHQPQADRATALES